MLWAELREKLRRGDAIRYRDVSIACHLATVTLELAEIAGPIAWNLSTDVRDGYAFTADLESPARLV